MKPTPSSLPDPPPVLAFGAHPDDIEFGGGGGIAQETRAGRAAHFVVCSRGEAATHGQPEQRVVEARPAAALLGATIEFVQLDGDLARFGGVRELRDWPPPSVVHLLFYALTRASEPDDLSPVLIDISAPEIVAAVDYATALFPADPLVFASLSGLGRATRGF
jgi:LmbE family N-acetylglucosaminyl deacetylase